MDYQAVRAQGPDTVVEGVRHFDLDEILDCGQCFRWERTGEKRYTGVALGRVLTITQQGDRLWLRDTTPAQFRKLWHPYFDFDRDYGAVKDLLRRDPAMARAVDHCPGMRVARQQPWEALCSFIISQNNNIPRIKGIIARLCAAFGEPLPGGHHAFPTPERLAPLSPEDLAEVRSGFRARYILDAARRVASGQLRLEPLYTLPLEEARAALTTVMGVGPKVAECALLYGFGRAACVPVDVWIGRALAGLFPGGLPEEFAPVAGLAQQYLFHYMRTGLQPA